MFNETTSDSPKPAWQGRPHRDGTLPVAMTSGPESPYGTVHESPGFLAPGHPQAATPNSANSPASVSSGGILDTLTGLPWYVYAVAAYFFFFRKGRR